VASYERTAHVSVAPEDLFRFICDARNFPRRPDARYDDLWIRLDDRDCRIDWGLRADASIRGFIEVIEEAIGSRLTLSVCTDALPDQGVMKDLERTLEILAAAVEERSSARS
jgi:hypothetical protein